VLDLKECDSLKPRLVVKNQAGSTSSAYKCLQPWPSPNTLPEDGDFGGDYFSSGEQNSYSDGVGSPGGSRSGYTSGSGSESDQEYHFDFYDKSFQTEARRLDLAAPLIKSRHTFAKRIGQGISATTAPALVSLGTVLMIDLYIWRVIRRPLLHCFLTSPFCIAAAPSTFLISICVPLLKRLKTHQVFQIEGPAAHLSKVKTPTMGGLYFIRVGVARIATGFWSTELWGVCVATLALGLQMIGWHFGGSTIMVCQDL